MMTRLTPEQVINREYGYSRNFMTPNLIEYSWVIDDKVAYELSSGTGFKNEPIYGVSIVRLHPDGTTERLLDKSDMFWSIAEARAHIIDVGTSLPDEGGDATSFLGKSVLT